MVFFESNRSAQKTLVFCALVAGGKFLGPGFEGALGYAEGLGGGADGEVAGLPGVIDDVEIFWLLSLWAAEFDAFGFGYGDAFGLALVVHALFHFGEVAEDGEEEVADETTGEVMVLGAGVKDGEIQDDDVGAFVFGDEAPVFFDFFVVAAEAVKLFDEEAVAGF